MSSVKSSTMGRAGSPVLIDIPGEVPPSVKSTIIPDLSL